uniref:Uncharacterized protein n=1 Tax=Lactuca sativa TaxID=4236 RepID=A0A9R1XHJ3_LACSA|nr:hypothetical protein LSAT_V11C400208990 [Lactuca sativa]
MLLSAANKKQCNKGLLGTYNSMYRDRDLETGKIVALKKKTLIQHYMFIIRLHFHGIYLIGFGLFFIETTINIWVIQQVYSYFRGSGKAVEMKCEATRSTLMAAL